jgi:endonuclease YncB( thermonuclease family)
VIGYDVQFSDCLNDVNFNLKMCSEGYAVAYYGQNKSLIVEAHLMNRKLLQERGLIK